MEKKEDEVRGDIGTGSGWKFRWFISWVSAFSKGLVMRGSGMGEGEGGGVVQLTLPEKKFAIGTRGGNREVE